MKKLIIISLVFILCASCSTEVEYLQKYQRPIPIELMTEKENSMITITNQYRVDGGLTEYKTSLDLYYLAKERVYQMVESDTLSHQGWYAVYQQSGALYYGESISYNYVSPEANIQGFHTSPAHWPMFISPIYEYIAVACEDNYTVVLVARWRPYNSSGKKREIKEIRTGNISTITIE